MNREIKFRGKTMNGRWDYGYLIKLADEDMCQIYPFENTTDNICGTFVISETVGQFTGLTDKHGNVIYEGDVIIVIDNGHLRKCVVEYDDAEMAGFYFSGCIDRIEELKDFEVIGNIHDNPELLTTKKL